MNPHRAEHRRSAASLLSGAALAALCFCPLAGCSGGPRVYNISGESYRGPALTIRPTPRQHVVVMEAPTPGWLFSFDASRRQFDHTDVFMTIVRPNPAYVHSQAMVSQEAGTEVVTSTPIVVYARVLTHDTIQGDQPYSRAIASESPSSTQAGPAGTRP